MSQADVIGLTLCYNGTLFGKLLSYMLFFGPAIIQAVLWGLFLQKRDALVWVVSNVYTLLLYYLLVVIRDVGFRWPRPFFVAECDRTLAFPDPWWIITSSFIATMIICMIIYRNWTAWRWCLIAFITGILALYITAPIVNGYFSMWQFFANLLLTVLITLLVTLSIHFFLVKMLMYMETYSEFHWLGFSMCLISEWIQPVQDTAPKKPVRKQQQQIKRLQMNMSSGKKTAAAGKNPLNV